MSFAKNWQGNKIYYSILLIFSVFIVYKLNLDRHWSSVIDMDIVVVYNSLLLNSGLKAEYFDHPAHSYILLNSYWYSILDKLGFIELSDFNSLMSSNNIKLNYQKLFYFSRLLNLIFIFVFSIFFFETLKFFNINSLNSFFGSLALILSSTFLNIAGILRTEMLSALCFYISLYFLFKIILDKDKKRLDLVLISFFFVISLFSKYSSILLFLFFPLFFIYIKDHKTIKIYKNISLNDYENKFIIKLFNYLFAIFFILIFFRYTKGYINFLFIPILIISFYWSFLLFKKKFNLGFNSSLYFFYLNIGMLIASIFLVSKPFSTTNIGIILNGMGFFDMYVNLNNPYSNDIYNQLVNLIIELVRNNFVYLNKYFIKFNTEGIILILNLICLTLLIYKKKYLVFINSCIVILIFLILILIFSLRPSGNYLVYVTPLLFINFVYMIGNIIKKNKILSNVYSFIFIFLIILNLNIKFNLPNNCNNFDCCKNLDNKESFLRYWQKKIDANILTEICKIN